MTDEPRGYLTAVPNEWGCHDPQCGDSTWDHECPVEPVCTDRDTSVMRTSASPHVRAPSVRGVPNEECGAVQLMPDDASRNRLRP